MKKNNKALQGIGALLPQLSQRRGWEEQLDLHSVFARWEELLDPEYTDHCWPLKIVKKVLWVEVENAAWQQQYQYQKVFILESLNKSLRIARLKDIRFCAAEKERNRKKKEEPVLRYIPPPPEELKAFEKQAGSISDKDAKDALLHFWYLSRACTKEEK